MNKFVWVNFYMELADKLLAYKENRLSLIEKIKDVYAIIGMDLPTHSEKSCISCRISSLRSIQGITGVRSG